MTSLPLHSLTVQALEAKFANKQRRYQSKYSASYLHHPSPPPRLAAPPRPMSPTFDILKAAAAALNLPEQDELHGPPAAALVVATRQHPVRKAILGGTVALACCALAAGGYHMWAAQTSNGGSAGISATLATLGQRFHDFAANQSLFRIRSEKAPLSAPAAEPAARDLAATSAVTPQQPDSLPALVRQMGLLVRDTQTENEKLRTDIASLVGTLQAKLTDLDQRMAATRRDDRDEAAQIRAKVAVLAETLQANGKTLEQRALAPARDPAAVAQEPGKQQDGAASLSAVDDGKAAAGATATGLLRIVPGYHVQAASFNVALLSDANAAPRQAGGRLVSVGDQVPGVGRVTGIIPYGTSWIVQTDHGTIQ